MRRQSAFTLVELLVVVGIIAVLISILLPVLRKAREQANVVACASNERQIYHALLLYAQVNRDWLPTPSYPPVPLRPNDITGYLDYGAYDYAKGVIWPYISGDPLVRQKLFLCPSDGPDRPLVLNGVYLTPPDPTHQRNFSYNFNTQLLGNLTDMWWPTGRGDLVRVWSGVLLTRIPHPANKILVVEGAFPIGSDSTFFSTFDPLGHPISTLGARHGGRANQCFADGHVELFDPSTVLGAQMRRYYELLDP